MKNIKLSIFTAVLSLLASTTASANLIINGGFEDNNVGKNSWAWFDADKVIGWEGSNIEIWDSYSNVKAFEGTQHAELNAHPSNGKAFSIFQNFDTQIGEFYNVSFAYSARSNNNEAFLFNIESADKTDIWSSLIDDHSVGQWNIFSNSFVAKDLNTTIRFTSVVPYSSTVGNFLDNIVVEQIASASRISQVSEPVGVMLLGVGLLVVMGNRKRKSMAK